MITKEISDIIKSKKSIIIMILVTFIPFIDFGINVWMCLGDYWLNPEAYPNGLPSWLYHPSYAAFLSGSSEGHIAQMLLVWLLPFYLLILYGDSYMKEREIGYHSIIKTRKSPKTVYICKLLTGFISGFSVIWFSMIINYVLCLFTFFNGRSFGGIEEFLEQLPAGLISFSIQSPIMTYIVYIFVFSVISGFYCMTCVALSFCIKSQKILYSICFAVWFLQIISPYSITYAIQPFIEYGMREIVPALIIFSSINVVVVSCCLYKVCNEEI